VTYNCPGNASNLRRIIMKPNVWLHDYTNRFFKNRKTCTGVKDD
jgi:hypothetical protein